MPCLKQVNLNNFHQKDSLDVQAKPGHRSKRLSENFLSLDLSVVHWGFGDRLECGAAADTGGGASRMHSHAEHGNENNENSLQTSPVEPEQSLKACPGKESRHFSEKS
jgi:hypothetical protein